MKVAHPLIAIAVFMGIGFILHIYGLNDGSFMIWDAIGGVAIYKIFARY